MENFKVLRRLDVPTGSILIVEGTLDVVKNPQLEVVSLGDYGKKINIKASFLGLEDDPGEVRHTELLPLTEKWVVTVSSQYGCSMGCSFCDVPKVGPGVDATLPDLINQLMAGLSLHPEITKTERLNVHIARMGEPTWNDHVLAFGANLHTILRNRLGDSLIHPVVSTMLPKKNPHLQFFLEQWMKIKNYIYDGDAGLQFSINSTSDAERDKMFSGNSLPLKDISEIGRVLPDPKGRKITLNFAVADYEINAVKLRELFDPAKFIVKLTPMHKTDTALANAIQTGGEYTTLAPYKHIEQELKDVGFDVLVFIASKEEDEGRITCGNAILAGTLPLCYYKEVTV